MHSHIQGFKLCVCFVDHVALCLFAISQCSETLCFILIGVYTSTHKKRRRRFQRTKHQRRRFHPLQKNPVGTADNEPNAPLRGGGSEHYKTSSS